MYTIDGVVGGLSAALPVNTILGVAGKAFVNMMGSGIQYIFDSVQQGQSMTNQGYKWAVGMGALSGAVDIGTNIRLNDLGITRIPKLHDTGTYISDALVSQVKRTVWGRAFVSAVSSLVTTTGTSVFIGILNDWR